MKIYITPAIEPRDKEWKLNDFHREGKWKQLLTKDELEALDIIPMGGEIIVNTGLGKTITIIRIL